MIRCYIRKPNNAEALTVVPGFPLHRMGNLISSCVLWGLGVRMPTVEGPFPAGVASTGVNREFSCDSTSKIHESLLVMLSQERAHLWVRDAQLFIFAGLPCLIFFPFPFLVKESIPVCCLLYRGIFLLWLV